MLNGFDISSVQAGMDVRNVPGDFVIIKATQETGYVNPYCDKHYQQAKACGKLRGTYHYAGGGNALSEANYFLKNIKGYIGDAILCLDWEHDLGYGRKNPLFGSSYAPAWIKTWCDEIYKQTGVKPLVYLQASALKDVKGIGDYGLWVAEYPLPAYTGYTQNPRKIYTYTCAIRQYTSSGRLSGFNADLDLDLFYGDKEAWMKYAVPAKKQETAKPTVISAPAKAIVKEDKAVYRLYNAKTNDHLFTANYDEAVNAVKGNYKYEGIGWHYGNGNPVYRLYNTKTGEHFLTATESEKSACVKAGWKLEGVAFKAGTKQPVYRLIKGQHHFTVGKTEKDTLIKQGWKLEGINFYAD